MASAAEREILACSLASIEGRGPPPDSVALLDAKRKRATANDLFKVAMEAMQVQAGRLKR
ncbi:hypothetical protein HQS1_47270 [Delftia lacustris]|nr:hypothetical protein HQS1_47270 [Delftia lacustris]